MRRDAFQAIADPTRREILWMLGRQSMNVNAVAENFDVSRTAVSKHIKILTECGLITLRQQGREKICHVHPEKLNEVSKWIDHYKTFWNKKLDNLGHILEKDASIITHRKPVKKLKK